MTGDNPPVSLFAIFGPWPLDPWSSALLDMRSNPPPDGTQWSDTTRYDLAGWQGTDARTGEHLFVVMAYRKANVPITETFKGAPTPAPAYVPPPVSMPQVPYYPQHPTGPISWPSKDQPPAPSTLQGRHSISPNHSVAPAYSQGYAMITGPLTNTAAPEPSPESYAPYYVGIPPRLVAALIDFVCTAIFELGALLLYIWIIRERPAARLCGVGGYLLGIFCHCTPHLRSVPRRSVDTVGPNTWKEPARYQGSGHQRQEARVRAGFAPYVGIHPLVLVGWDGGFLLVAFDARRQALHDKIAETYVVPETPPSPVPAGLPGYSALAAGSQLASQGAAAGLSRAGALGMANVAGAQAYEVVRFTPEHIEHDAQDEQAGLQSGRQTDEDRNIFREIASLDESLKTVVILPELPDQPEQQTAGTLTTAHLSAEHTTGNLVEQILQQHGVRTGSTEQARELFRRGIEQMEKGVEQTERGYRVEVAAARRAALLLQEASEV